MERITLQVGTFEVNCSLIIRDGRALIVDPGQEPDRIAGLLAKEGLAPAGILLTHAHFDHIGAVPALLERFPALAVGVSAADAKLLSHPMNRLPPDYPPAAIPAERIAAPGVFAADWGYAVIETPGHTPGGVCYHFPEMGLLLSGDTLFAGSVGRTDLPGGDMATLMDSLEKLRPLPPETVVIPGHGMTTTIGRELEGNPFLQ